MSFSFSDGIQIALIKGGHYNNQILFLDKENEMNSIEQDYEDVLSEILSQPYYTHRKVIGERQYQILLDALESNEPPKDFTLRKIFNEVKEILNREDSKIFNLDIGSTLIPLPQNNEGDNNRILIAGQSGSGKSYMASQYIKSWKKMYPHSKIFLFSKKEEDENLDKLPITRIPLEEISPKKKKKLKEEENKEEDDKPLDVNDFPDNSLVIFDDIDSSDSFIQKAVHKLKDDFLDTGRSKNICVIVTSHLLTDWKKSRNSLNECSQVILFPSGISRVQSNRFLKDYCGLNKDVVEKLYKLKSRWFLLYRNTPKYVIHEHGGFVID